MTVMSMDTSAGALPAPVQRPGPARARAAGPARARVSGPAGALASRPPLWAQTAARRAILVPLAARSHADPRPFGRGPSPLPPSLSRSE